MRDAVDLRLFLDRQGAQDHNHGRLHFPLVALCANGLRADDLTGAVALVRVDRQRLLT